MPSSRSQIERLLSLVRASRLLNTALELEVVLETFIKTAVGELQSEHGTLYLINPERTELASFALVHDPGSTKPKLESIRLPMGQGIAGHVAASGKPVLLDDPYSDPRFNREVDRRSGVRTRNLLTVPVQDEKRETIGVMQVLNHPTGYVPEDIDFLIELSSQAAVAIDRARLHSALLVKSRIEKELEIAREIQLRLLPPVSLSRVDFQVESYSQACYQVGGDFFDVEAVGEKKFVLACGDVSGKGIPAALLNSMIKASYRHLLQQFGTPQPMVERLNRFINENVQDNRFCTMVVAGIDLESRQLTYCNAGHNYPLLIRADGSAERLSKGGIPLGMLPIFDYEQAGETLSPGDTLLLYSDGVTEAANPAGEEFSEERLISLAQSVTGVEAKSAVKQICAALHDFTGDHPQADDITLLLCRVL